MTADKDLSRHYPTRPIVGVGAVIFKGESVLLIKRAKPPSSDRWSLPGGAVELGERLTDAILREVLEETGLEIALVGLIDAVDAILPDGDGRIRHHYALIDYVARWVAGEPQAGSDAADARWFAWDEALSLPMWGETLRILELARTIYKRDAGL